jgi:lipooligosaccharide transport system permease protein
MTALRLTPLFALGNLRAWRIVERNMLVYSHTWMVLLSGFFEPFFYLLSIGFGLGRLVGDVAGPGGQTIPYALFVAPALLAASSMNGAITESTFNFFFKLNYDKTFASILTTPMSPADISLGELAWALMRGALYTIGFLVVMVLFNLVRSPLVLLTLPGSLLIGFAFAAAGMAATSFMRTWQDFDLIQLVILPMFLFSGTFFPIDGLPDGIRLLVQLTPLYQGVDLLRMLSVGVVGPEALFHLTYLVVMGLIGLAIVSRRLDKLLLK